jgi:hypothetical protein
MMPRSRCPHRGPVGARWLAALALGATLLATGPARAGEIVLSKTAIEVDGAGKITAASRKGSIDSTEADGAEETWTVHVWAQLDRGAPGPLYIEFWDRWQGQDIKVPYRHEVLDYDGGKYITLTLELEGNRGFNRDHTYRLRVFQVDEKGKEVQLAGGAKIKLLVNEKAKAEAEKKKKAEEEEEARREKEEEEADEPKGGGGGGDSSHDEVEAEGPPELEPPVKKGCTVAADAATPGSLAGLLLLGVARRRRRR